MFWGCTLRTGQMRSINHPHHQRRQVSACYAVVSPINPPHISNGFHTRQIDSGNDRIASFFLPAVALLYSAWIYPARIFLQHLLMFHHHADDSARPRQLWLRMLFACGQVRKDPVAASYKNVSVKPTPPLSLLSL